MAYSDYGGYAYRNGVRVCERSDATIGPNGDVFGSPGMWPGFAAMIQGGKEEYDKRKDWPSGHAILGDGPVHVVLYKQSTVRIYGPSGELDLLKHLVHANDESVKVYKTQEGEVLKWVNDDYFRDNNKSCIFEIDGWRLDVRFTHEDNYYQYAELKQPDGVLWHGWAGYGVGAGLEHCGYGYCTDEREDMLWSLFDRPQTAKVEGGEG